MEGTGKFLGTIAGSLSHPIFDGNLDADKFVLNGVELSNIHGHVGLEGTRFFLDEFSFNQGDGIYTVFASADTATEVLNGHLSLENIDIPELFALANTRTKLLEGKLTGEVNLGGSMNNPSVNLTGEIPTGTFAGFDIHGIDLEINLLNNIIYFNKFEGKQGELGDFNLAGTADISGPLALNLAAHNLALGMFSSAAGLKNEVDGTANIEATIGGVVLNPKADALITATGGVDGANFDLLKAQLTLQDWMIGVKEFIVQKTLAEKIYQISADGILPLRALTAGAKENLTDAEQINLNVSMENADLSLLPVLSKQVAWAIGNMEGAVKITGTAAHPKINGKIALNGGSVKIKGMKSLIENINISTLFKDERFDVEEFSGFIGGGTFYLNGGLNFGGLEISDYKFDFVAENLNPNAEFFYGPINAAFTLDEGQRFRRTLPRISGHLDLEKCTIGFPSLPDSEGEMPEIIMNVDLNLGKKVHLYSSSLFDMFITGGAKFEGTTRHPKTSGTIDVRRGGTVTYLNTIFKITEGAVMFNQFDTFYPSVVFHANAKMGRTKIFIDIDGPLTEGNIKAGEKAIFKLSSSPEMTEAEIIQLLTFKNTASNGGDLGAADVLAIGLQMSVLADIEDAVRKTLGFDQFSVSRGSGSVFDNHDREGTRKSEEYNVTVGKYVSDDVMLKYTRGIGGDKVNRFGVQYDMNENIGLSVEHEGHDFIFGLEARYKF